MDLSVTFSLHHVLTLLSFIALSFFFKNNFMKIMKNFPNVHFYLSLFPLPQKLILLSSEKIHIEKNGRKKILPTLSDGELASLVLAAAGGEAEYINAVQKSKISWPFAIIAATYTGSSEAPEREMGYLGGSISTSHSGLCF